jgi:hypothetical protein
MTAESNPMESVPWAAIAPLAVLAIAQSRRPHDVMTGLRVRAEPHPRDRSADPGAMPEGTTP